MNRAEIFHALLGGCVPLGGEVPLACSPDTCEGRWNPSARTR